MKFVVVKSFVGWHTNCGTQIDILIFHTYTSQELFNFSYPYCMQLTGLEKTNKFSITWEPVIALNITVFDNKH